MTATIQFTKEPCQYIEHWQAASISTDVWPEPIQACWLAVGDDIEVIYWVNGMAFIFKQSQKEQHSVNQK